MSTTIEDRFVLILREQISPRDAAADEHAESLWTRVRQWWSKPAFPGRGAWEALQRETGISSQSWRSAYTRRQKPTPAMIQALAQMFPCYAFWLVTGITDGTNGHIAPMTALTFPERLYRESLATNEYFRTSLRLAKRLYEDSGVDLNDEKQRMYLVERNMPLAHWVGGPLVTNAYELANDPEYKRLVEETWKEREKERKEDLARIEGKDRPWKNETKSGRGNPVLGRDSREQHQDPWDLFYIPPSR